MALIALKNDFLVTRAEFETLKTQFEKLTTHINKNPGQEDRVSIVVFSGALDKLIAAFIIATGAAASGMKVELFFTFWGTSGFKKTVVPSLKKTFLEKIFGWMLPRGSTALPLSQMNMAGMGPQIIRYLMKKKNVPSLEELIETASELGVRVNICEMSMELMGIQPEELRNYPGLSYCGVATFLENSSKGKMTLFI